MPPPTLVRSQDRADPSQQFPRIERLGQIIVGADFQTNNAVHVFAATP